jgi:hypothetical protein
LLAASRIRARTALVALATVFGCTPFLDAPGTEFSDADRSSETSSTYLEAETPIIDAWFGYSLRWGGEALAVTAPFETIPSGSGPIEHGGAVYLFEPLGTTWKQTRLQMPNVGRWDGMITDDGRPTIYSAIHVALDDESVFVGVAEDDSSSQGDPNDDSMPGAGALYVYDRARLDQHPTYLKAPVVRERTHFGYALALSDDWLIVAASSDGFGPDDRPAPSSGKVYAYRRDGNRLEPPQPLNAPNFQAGDQFGAALALEGDTLVVGAPREDSGAAGVDGTMNDESVQDCGAAYVYRLIGDTWTFEHYLKPAAPQTDMRFGSELSLSDLTLAFLPGYHAIGAAQAARAPAIPPAQDDHSVSGPGRVYLFPAEQ